MRLYMEFQPSGSDDVFNFDTSFIHTLTKEQATSMFREMLDTANAYVQKLGLNTSKSVQPKAETKPAKAESTKHERKGADTND